MKTRFCFLFLFFHSCGFAQNRVMEIQKKFDAYQSEWSSNHLQLFFNQEKYVPGDTIYFKAYFFKEDKQPVEGKQLIEVNLVDHSGKSIQTIRFHVTDGNGYNQLRLSENVPPGLYLLTAHSNWMRNFEPIPFFRKQITIVGKNRIESVSPDINVAVEGGHLIAGIEQKIVIGASKPGLPVTLVDDAGTPILTDTTNYDGLGSFSFTPESHRSYFVQVEGKARPLSLSGVHQDGCMLSVIPEEERIGLRISAPRGSRFLGNELWVVLTALGKIQASKVVILSQSEVSVAHFSREELPAGIIKASLIDASGNLLSTRDFFNERGKRVVVKLKSSKHKYRTREQITLEVSLSDDIGGAVNGDFCISVLNNAAIDKGSSNPMAMRMQERMTREELVPDNFVILQTRELPWNRILADKLEYPNHALTRNIRLNGTVYADDDGAPLADNTKVMFYLQHSKMNYQTFTIGGKVRLTMPDIYGDDEFFYIAETKNGREISGITVRWDFDSLSFPTPLPEKVGDQEDPYAAFAKRRRLIEQSYHSEVQLPFTMDSTTTDFQDEIASADLSVNVNEYIPFSTMSELIREVVPSLFYRRAGQKGIVRISLNEPMTATGDPVYIIDGIASRNTDFFLSLVPSEIISIKVVKEPKKLARFGLLGKNGFVIVQTKKGNLREPLKDAARIYNGLSMPHNFSSVDPADVPIHTPIFRSTVYWNPSIQVDASGKAVVQFFSTDDVGSLQIRIHGYDAHGNHFSASEEIEIELGGEKR